MDLEYEIKKSKRAKNIRLTVRSDASVVLTIPWWAPKYVGKRFFEAKKEWVIKKINELRINPSTELRTGNEELNKKKLTRVDYLKNREKARVFITERLKYFNQLYDFEYRRVAIRDTRTRWGSCSRAGNLNFSYKLLFMPREVADYIIVHELCHAKELNHSARFWNLVERAIPNHKSLRKELKKNLF